MAKCLKCNKEWKGKAECHCSGCHKQFKSISAFDKHRIGKKSGRRCMTVTEMEESKMVLNIEKGWWTGEVRPTGLRYGIK